jgi:hypothetical protein
LDTVSGVLKYSKDAQALALVTKVPWPTTINRRKAAEKVFQDCESKCAETNYLLSFISEGLFSNDRTLNAMREILHHAKRYLTRLLGPLPDDLSGRFGPGTSFELKGHPFSTVADKLTVLPSSTSDAEPVFRFLAEPTLWFRSRLAEGLPFIARSRGNRFTTVPKNGKTDRGICVEPGGNLWSQLAVGDYMKERLKRVGLDCSRSSEPADPIQRLRRRLSGRFQWTGQHTHREMAYQASLDGAWATLDLSNASDTVATKLVELLLPEDWWQLLRSLRSPHTLHGRRWVHLQKFSSMGNGFTFELETAIFAALIVGVSSFDGKRLCPGEDFWVYGDDIIIPTWASNSVSACLEAFGFRVNEKKSFATGLFRESCGGDFYCGFDVRPFFIKDEPSNPLDWVDLHNQLKRRGLNPTPGLMIGMVPSKLRLFGPPSVGGVFHTHDSVRWRTWNSYQVTWLRRIVPVPRRYPLARWPDWIHLSFALVGGSSEGVMPRNEVSGFKVVPTSVS